MVDRFGTRGVIYGKKDEKHLTLTTKIEVSDQFFGWLLGFGKRAKLIGPESVVEDLKAYLDKVQKMYEV
jgi:predicted DNA-binding transcriptional regulator YafY